jgi:glyoxylase-like metal-dependent hydrolase (beta-lactamase superfamily II)
MKYFISFILLITSLTNVMPVYAQDDYDIQVVRMTDNLYKIAIDVLAYEVNMVASVGEDGILLVDTGVKDAIKGVKEKLDVFGKGNPKFIINSHAHIDHTGGNEAFGPEPIIIAHDIIRTRLRSGRYIIDEFPDEALPDITFTDSLSLHFNGEKIRVIAVSGSHDDNDAIVYFTKSKVAYLGDLAYGMHFPSVDGTTGNASKYAEAVKKAIALLPEDAAIVSGHGRDCTYSEMQEFQEMLEQTTNVVRAELEKGKDVAEMQAANLLEDWNQYGGGYVSANGWIKSLVDGIVNRRPKKSLLVPLYLTSKKKGVEAVIEQYFEIKNSNYDEYRFDDLRLYIIAYKIFLEKGRYDEAIRLMELNLTEYPSSANSWATYDGLGEAYMKMGNNKLALVNYKKSLELNPDNLQASKMIEKLE